MSRPGGPGGSVVRRIGPGAALAALVGAVASLALLTSAGAVGAARPIRCAAAAVRISRGAPVSPQTGEHSQLLKIVNRSRFACRLAGYPHVSLYAGSRRLPFVWRDGGTPYFDARPARVVLAPGARAWFIIAKYRCDGGIVASATRARVTLPGSRRGLVVRLADAGETGLSYCSRYPGDARIDPGNRVFVSRIERSIAALFTP